MSSNYVGARRLVLFVGSLAVFLAPLVGRPDAGRSCSERAADQLISCYSSCAKMDDVQSCHAACRRRHEMQLKDCEKK